MALVSSISLLLLGGAWLLSRALTSDVPVPALNFVPPPKPTDAPGVAPNPRPAPVIARDVVTSPPPEPEPGARPLPPPPPPPEEGPSPEKVELDGIALQGWAQLKDEHGGPATWRRAEKFFIRCLTLSPEDQGCKDGLSQARERIGPKFRRSDFPIVVPVQDPPPRDPEE